MKTIKFFAAALAIVAAASCSEKIDDNTGVEDATPELVEVSFEATIDSPSDPSTKTTLADDGLSVHWTEGDKILLYKSNQIYYYSSNRSELSAENISGNTTTFSGTAVSSSTYDAIYPYASTNLSQSNSGHNFWVNNTLANQTLVASNFSKTSWGVSNIAMASGVANGEILRFYNVLSHFKFSVASAGIRTLVISAASLPDWYSGRMSSYLDLGGTLIYRFNDKKIYANSNTPITVTNGGVDFVVGETYYVAFPPFEMTDLTFTFKDADGKTLGTLAKSSFSPAANTIYDLGVLNVTSGGTTQETTLSVSPTNLTVNAKNGSASFTLNTNTNWTISSNKDWLSFSETSGESATDKTITVTAENNTEYSTRYADITVTAGDKSATIYLTQSAAVKVYTKGAGVHARDMRDGGNYVICLMGDQSLYWTISNDKLVLANLTDGEIHIENVLTFNKDDAISTDPTVNAGDKYKSLIVGTLSPVGSTRFLDSGFKISAGTALILTFANLYGSDTGYDIDIYQYDTENFIHRKEYTSNVGCGTTGWYDGNNGRKWYIYEVSE